MAQVEQPRAVAVHSLPSERRETENDVRGVLLERVLRLTPPEFEKLVGAFLQAKGFSNVRVTGKSGDDGIDGECEMPFIKVKVAFQAKRYTTGNSVGIDPVQRLQGSMGRNFDRGIFITTSSFTSPARGWVEETHAPIALIDGDELVGQMVELGLGIKTVPVVRQELDQGFFTSLEKRP